MLRNVCRLNCSRTQEAQRRYRNASSGACAKAAATIEEATFKQRLLRDLIAKHRLRACLISLRHHASSCKLLAALVTHANGTAGLSLQDAALLAWKGAVDRRRDRCSRAEAIRLASERKRVARGATASRRLTRACDRHHLVSSLCRALPL
jgi:hypothetical protein